jgi:hypothetical protein
MVCAYAALRVSSRHTISPVTEERAPLLALFAGAGLAAVGLVLAGATGGPYLDTDSVNAWIVVFAAGLLAALFATPFAIERRMRPTVAESDRRWERSLLAWGAVAVAVLLAGFLLGVAADWASGSSLAGAAGLLITIEAVLVLGTMIVWLLSG